MVVDAVCPLADTGSAASAADPVQVDVSAVRSARMACGEPLSAAATARDAGEKHIKSKTQEIMMGAVIPGGVDRRQKSREKLDALVASRTETLSLLAELAERQPFSPDPSMEKALRRFCEALIDYTASAHFQLYRYLADNRERRRTVLEIADELYPKIVETTDTILRFNDKYEGMSLDNSVEFLAVDLSNLGECIADRIQYEDRVIQAMSA